VSHKTACIVRVPEAAEMPIKRALDLGAHGIIVPQVNTAEQADDVVRWSRYAPEGARGVGLARAQGYGAKFREYLSRANDEIAVIVQAEHSHAVDNIEAIARVPGVDAVLLGPYDLSASLGLMGQIDHPTVVAAIRRVTVTRSSSPASIRCISARERRRCSTSCAHSRAREQQREHKVGDDADRHGRADRAQHGQVGRGQQREHHERRARARQHGV
jgi:2-keto-3-deoxy-L-rhamnonate aldolase RhmA